MGLGPEIYNSQAAGPQKDRRLFVYNGGFLRQKRLRQILNQAGYRIHLGRPSEGDAVAVWGNSPTAHRGLKAAEKHGVPVVWIEDAFLRSLFPGRSGEPPLGVLIDHKNTHFDPTRPSDLETLLAQHPLDDTNLLNRARGGIARLAENHLTKYTAFDPDAPAPAPGYVLVIDQTQGDASVSASGADRARFLEMLVFAQEEHPGANVIIKTHPETRLGHRPGYFGPDDCNDRISLLSDPVSPWALFEGAVGVYTVSSQIGFEAIFAGHKPRIFGQPFYAGWGLTVDEFPVQRRNRTLTRAQLFAAAMILYPTWFNPYSGKIGTFEDALAALEAQTHHWRADHNGWLAEGMRLWKRPHLQRFFGRHKAVVFGDTPPRPPRKHMVWASKATTDRDDITRVEDGFLRSKGLGAALVPPVSLICDDKGIYYDPTRPSRLEDLIALRTDLRSDQYQRAVRLIETLQDAALSKYNLTLSQTPLPDHTGQRRILVPGQVADDASLQKGAGEVADNLALLTAVRTRNPDAFIIYKPHPDVEAGLREGAIDATSYADFVATQSDPITLLGQVDEVSTMTSLLGFEALIRRVSVVTYGMPFYAGWGLTTDYAPRPDRRRAEPALQGLVHACLIDYPRYVDPRTGLPCPVEVIVERLTNGDIKPPAFGNRMLSKLQGVLASQSHLWR